MREGNTRGLLGQGSLAAAWVRQSPALWHRCDRGGRQAGDGIVGLRGAGGDAERHWRGLDEMRRCPVKGTLSFTTQLQEWRNAPISFKRTFPSRWHLKQRVLAEVSRFRRPGRSDRLSTPASPDGSAARHGFAGRLFVSRIVQSRLPNCPWWSWCARQDFARSHRSSSNVFLLISECTRCVCGTKVPVFDRSPGNEALWARNSASGERRIATPGTR